MVVHISNYFRAICHPIHGSFYFQLLSSDLNFARRATVSFFARLLSRHIPVAHVRQSQIDIAEQQPQRNANVHWQRNREFFELVLCFNHLVVESGLSRFAKCVQKNSAKTSVGAAQSTTIHGHFLVRFYDSYKALPNDIQL